jgi:hypothetical protein
MLKTVDGMASIDEVTAAIGRALAETAFRPGPPKGAGRGPGKNGKKKAPDKPATAKKAPAKGKKAKTARPAARPAQARRKQPKSRGKAQARRLTK